MNIDEPDEIRRRAGTALDGLAVVPTHRVRVRQAVGDVEPAEVVGEVELAGDVVAQHPFTDGLDDDVEHAVDPRSVPEGRGGGLDRRGPLVAEEGHEEASVVAPAGVDVGVGQRAEVGRRERPTERAHVRELVLAGPEHERRHEVWEHRGGAIPADQLQEFEGLL